MRPYPNQVTVDTWSIADPSNQIWTQCLKCLRTKQYFQNYFVLTCVNVDRDSLTFICCHIILCRFEKYEIFTNICQFSCFNQYFFLFTLLLTPVARLPVLGPFLAGGAFGSKAWRGPAYTTVKKQEVSQHKAHLHIWRKFWKFLLMKYTQFCYIEL